MAEKRFSSNEVLDNVEIKDPTVEVIGYVDKIIPPSETAVGKKHLKFFLNNAQGRQLQVVIWDKNMIATMQKLVHSVNLIVHINGALANAPKVDIFNKGNLPYELIIQTSTTVTIEGSFTESKPMINVKNIELKECGKNVGQMTKVKGYISCTFRRSIGKYATYFIASITDGTYKVELRSNEDIANAGIILGTYVQVNGIIEKPRRGPIHIRIISGQNIIDLHKKKMGLEKILSGYKQCEQ